MQRVTTHEAKTNLSQLLSRVLEGEEILICRGAVPVARLVPVDRSTRQPSRPAVGTVTSGPLSWAPDAFAPLSDEELTGWGL